VALPENQLSVSAAPAPFVGARSLPITPIVDYEDGGIAISDPSRGLLYQRWRAILFRPGEVDSYVQLDAREVAPFTLLELPNITEISIAFDQLMRPTLAFVRNGIAYLRWFDSVPGQYVITEIGAGIITPRVSMDDKRLLATDGYQLNDVILAYVREGNLYYRQQRDRFLIERLLAEGVKPLIKIGFSRGLRFQFMSEV
jgi:hypothetical protein